MIITDDFIFIHIPKTGGTFVMKIIEHLHNHGIRNGRNVATKYLTYECPDVAGVMTGHNYSYQIPEEFRRLPVVSIARDPFDWYISYYEYELFADKREKPFLDYDPIVNRFPTYPNLSFDEFFEFIHHFFLPNVFRDTYEGIKYCPIGLYSIYWIFSCFRDPFKFLESHLKEIPPATGLLLNNLSNMHFLRFGELRSDLFDWLCAFGYQEKDLSFIRNHPKENVGSRRQRENRKWYYSQQMIKHVYQVDAIGIELYHAVVDNHLNP